MGGQGTTASHQSSLTVQCTLKRSATFSALLMQVSATFTFTSFSWAQTPTTKSLFYYLCVAKSLLKMKDHLFQDYLFKKDALCFRVTKPFTKNHLFKFGLNRVSAVLLLITMIIINLITMWLCVVCVWTELPGLLQLGEVAEALLCLPHGSQLLCQLVANFPESFMEGNVSAWYIHITFNIKHSCVVLIHSYVRVYTRTLTHPRTHTNRCMHSNIHAHTNMQISGEEGRRKRIHLKLLMTKYLITVI